MEVKKGYKHTEIGVIPEDWECTSVDHLVNIGVLEKPLDGNHGEIHPKSSDFVEYGIPFVMANNVQNGRVDLENCSFIRKEQADRLRIGFSYPGDVLLTHKATIGNTAIVGEISSEYIMLTPQVTYYRVTDKTRLNNYYLRHFFDSSAFQKIMVAKSGGGTRAYIGVSAQRQLPVVLPSTLAEQEAIAEALSDADALIESLETLLAKKRQVKQGAMSELLTGKRRLPGFSGEWEVKTLGEIGDTDPENLTSKTDPDYSFKYISLEDVDFGVLRNYTELTFRFAPSRARRKLRKNDLLISTVRPNLKSHLFIREEVSDMVCSTGFCVLRCNPNIANPTYIYFHLFANQIERQIETLLTGSNYPSINSKDVKALQIPLPDVAEQTAIAEILSDMDAEIRAVEEKLSKARAVKAGMMSALLTGRVRLV